jgi:hypothetical protein
MRTDKQKKADAIMAISKLSVEDLRTRLFDASVLIELMVMDMAYPVLNEELQEGWLKMSWDFLHNVRTEEHMNEVSEGIVAANSQISLLLADAGNAQ